MEANTTNFYRQKTSRDGLNPWCKPCRKEYKNTNKDRQNEINRKRRETDEAWRESRNKGTKKWRENNREHKREYERQRRERYPEEYKNRSLEYQQRNPEEVKVAARARQRIYQLIKDGLLSRPKRCTWCDETHSNIEAAHHNYDLSLDVIWLCKPCHSKWDYEMPKLFGDSEVDIVDYFYGEESNRDAKNSIK